jgi:hypothetical protein
MSKSLEFTTTRKDESRESDKQYTVPFTVDGVEYLARKPKDALIAQLGPVMSRRTTALVKVQLALDFLEDAVLEPGRTVLRDRLLSEDDDFDARDAVDVLHGIAKHWKELSEAAPAR